MHLFAKAAALIATSLLVTVSAGQADAATGPVIDLSGAGSGSFGMPDPGTARLSGNVTGVPFDGRYTAVLAAVDGSLPEPGVCEPATATLNVTGKQHRFLRLAATGDVCGLWTDETYVVTHRFEGRYDVTSASAPRARGTDGWISLVLATEGRANVEAIDT